MEGEEEAVNSRNVGNVAVETTGGVESDSAGTAETGSVIDEAENRTIDNSAAAELSDKTSKRKYESWYTVDVFLFFLTCFQLVNLLTLTYTDSVLNYIAKRFQIPNTMASFIPSSYQLGNVIAIIPVSYFGAKWHRPRAICIGVMLMILGLGFCVLPQFILPNDRHSSGKGSAALCNRRGMSPFLLNQYQHEFKRHNLTFPSLNWSALFQSEEADLQYETDTTKHKKISWYGSILLVTFCLEECCCNLISSASSIDSYRLHTVYRPVRMQLRNLFYSYTND